MDLYEPGREFTENRIFKGGHGSMIFELLQQLQKVLKLITVVGISCWASSKDNIHDDFYAN